MKKEFKKVLASFGVVIVSAIAAYNFHNWQYLLLKKEDESAEILQRDAENKYSSILSERADRKAEEARLMAEALAQKAREDMLAKKTASDAAQAQARAQAAILAEQARKTEILHQQQIQAAAQKALADQMARQQSRRSRAS